MANKKFTPRASTNLIENEVADEVKEETPVEETEVTTPEAPEEVAEPDVTPEVVEEEAKDEVPEEDKEVTFTAETEKKPIARMVKIRLAKKYDGCIGGVWYHFSKDQVVNVPENVKRILNSTEGMLKPL